MSQYAKYVIGMSGTDADTFWTALLAALPSGWTSVDRSVINITFNMTTKLTDIQAQIIQMIITAKGALNVTITLDVPSYYAVI